MKKRRNGFAPNHTVQGFTPLLIVLIVGLVLAATVGGAYYFGRKYSSKPAATKPEGHSVPASDKLIDGKTLEKRLDDAYTNLHRAGSSALIQEDFPDVELVYTDDPDPSIRRIFPQEILPFHYYYSAEANKTFNLCGVGRSVFICEGKIDRMITKEDIDSGRCEVTPIYLGDPRLGGRGGKIDFDY